MVVNIFFPGRIAVFAAFFLSGFSALVFEVVWVRLFTRVFGHTTLAVSAVLAAFMAGLALGSYLGGRFADRCPRPWLLIAYALAEIGIAFTGLLTKPAIDLIDIFLPKWGVLNLSPVFQNLSWFGLTFFILIIPTSLMGATLPILTRWFALAGRQEGPWEASFGYLYGLNTLGAMMGTAAAGFYLIFAFGLTKTLLFSASLNIVGAILAAGALFVSDGYGRNSAPLPDAGEHRFLSRDFSLKKSVRPLVLAFLLFASGAAGMICEVAWTRAFTFVLGSSTYAFSIMLITFLLGIALGALLFGLIRQYMNPNLGGLAVLFALIGFSILVYLPFFNHLPYLFIRLFPLTYDIWMLHGIQTALCVIVMILPTVLMGTALPWGLALADLDSKRIGAPVGFFYAFNTLGAIGGSVLAGLFLIAAWGTERTLAFAVVIYAGLALTALMLPKGRKRKKYVLAGSLTAFLSIALWARPRWDPYILTSGSFLYAPDYQHLKSFSDFRKDLRRNKLVFYKDGASSTVAVLENPWAGHFLRINGKTDASTGLDMTAQILSGALPVLFHSGEPERGLVIGLGSGASAASLASDKNVKQVECVEIEPAVAQALPYFEKINHGIQRDPRFRLIFADARHYLAATAKKYDVIASEPSNPWIAGISNLFTKEAFELAEAKLAPGGVFCQWFHSYSMGVADFRMVLKTFVSVFPHTMLFTTGERDFFLVGSNEPWNIRYDRFEQKFLSNGQLKNDLARLGIQHPFSLLFTTFLLDEKDLADYAAGAPLHVDDRPTLEFSAPRYLHRGESDAILTGLLAAKKASLPSGLKNIDVSKKEWALLYNLSGEAFMRYRDLARADFAFRKAMEMDPANARTWTNVGRIHNAVDKYLQAEQAYNKAIELERGYALPWFHLGMLYLDQGLDEKALHFLNNGLKRSPHDLMGCIQVAKLYLKREQLKEARGVLQQAVNHPSGDSHLYKLAERMLNDVSAQIK